MGYHERLQSAADCVLPKGENNEKEIQGDQFNHEVANGLTKEKKEKEQKNSRIGAEKKKQIDHGPVHLSVTISKRLRNPISESAAHRPFQTRETRAQHFLFGDITKVELEQEFFEEMVAPRHGLILWP